VSGDVSLSPTWPILAKVMKIFIGGFSLVLVFHVKLVSMCMLLLGILFSIAIVIIIMLIYILTTGIREKLAC